MKKVFMACAAALAMSIASCSSSTTCYTCTQSFATATICDGKVTFTGLAAGVPAPSYPGSSNDDIKKIMETAGYKCVAK
jgi:hypothetical protein